MSSVTIYNDTDIDLGVAVESIRRECGLQVLEKAHSGIDARSANIGSDTYDGFAIQDIFARSTDVGRGELHVAVLDILCCTMDEEKRLHARPVILSNPALISVPGMVSGPARTKEYYLAEVANARAGRTVIQPQDDHLCLGDVRTAGAIRIYLLQALSYLLTGEPFCANNRCIMYNFHWQKDLLEALSGSPCKYHAGIMQR